MKLSEAILLGSVHTKQAYYEFVTNDNIATCAQGAALDAVGQLDRDILISNHTTFERLWPWTREGKTQVIHPGTGHSNRFVRLIIAELNNHYRWTRPQIAAWVATIEPQELEPQEESSDTQCFTSTIEVKK